MSKVLKTHALRNLDQFVMNTHEEVDTAMKDYQSNNFVRDKAWMNKVKVK